MSSSGRTLHDGPQQRRRALTTAAQQSSGLPSEWTDSHGQRLGPITQAFCTGPGAAKVYRLSFVRTELSVSEPRELSVSELSCVRIKRLFGTNTKY
jgi:hypothetical protein